MPDMKCTYCLSQQEMVLQSSAPFDLSPGCSLDLSSGKKLLETIYIRVQMYLVFAAHRGLSHPALQRLLDVEALKSWVTSHNSYAFRCYASDLKVRACSLFSLDPPLAAGANLINLIESILFAIILYLYPGDQEALCHVVQSRLASKFSSFGYSF